MCVFNDRLYAGTMNWDDSSTGYCQVWRTTNYNGTEWERVVDKGFRDGKGAGPDAKNVYAWRMTEFQHQLYVGTYNIPNILKETGEQGCELFRTLTGNNNSSQWEMMHLPNGYHERGFGEHLNYGIRGLVNWSNQSLYVGVTAEFWQLITPSKALEIWRYQNISGVSNWTCIVGNKTTQNATYRTYDGFGNSFNKYPWSMAICNNKLWIGTWNYQINNKPDTYGCEIWNYNPSNQALTAVVKNKTAAYPHTELQSGFGYQWNMAARSMLEFPAGSGNLVVGTVTESENGHGCEVWIRWV